VGTCVVVGAGMVVGTCVVVGAAVVAGDAVSLPLLHADSTRTPVAVSATEILMSCFMSSSLVVGGHSDRAKRPGVE
jgi:hypothetical protein